MMKNSLGNRHLNMAFVGSMALAALGSIAVFVRMMQREVKDWPSIEDHHHDALEHSHEHLHVTHQRTDEGRGVGGWQHLTASHNHRHNHAALRHSHRPHRNLESEHREEAHLHDHDNPTGAA